MNTYLFYFRYDLYLLKGSTIAMVLSVLFLTGISQPVANKPKVVLSKFKCSTRNEKQLNELITGSTRVDSAFNRIKIYFREGDGDYFQLKCYNCGINSGAMIMEYPVKSPVKLKPSSDAFNTTNSQKINVKNLNKSLYNNPDVNLYFKNFSNDSIARLQDLLAEAILQTSRNKSDLNITIPFIEGHQLQDEWSFQDLFKYDNYKPFLFNENGCLVACKLVNYQEIYTKDYTNGAALFKGKKAKRLSLSYTIQIMRNNPLEIISSKSFDFMGNYYVIRESGDTAQVMYKNAVSMIASEIVTYLNSQRAILTVDSLNKVELTVKNLSYKEFISVLDTISAFQPVINVEENFKRDIGKLVIRYACSIDYLMELMNSSSLMTKYQILEFTDTKILFKRKELETIIDKR